MAAGTTPPERDAAPAHDTQVAQADARPERHAEVLDSAPALPRFADAPLAGTPPTDMPRAEHGANAVPGSRLLLAARQVTALSGTHRGVAAELDGGAVDPHAPPSAQGLVEELVSESVGRGRVERGLVHPYYGQLGKALMKAWDADRSVKEHGLQGYFDMGMERGRAYSRIWMERAADYGASGSFAAKNGPGEDRRRPLSTAGDPTLNARREMRQQMRQEFRTTRRALIRVVQDAQGQLVDVQLLEPSHQPEVDKEALKDVRAMAEKLPPPPDEAVGGRSRLSSVWEFELLISISPPIPTFSFEFDEALGFIDTRLPLDRRIYKRVRLVEVR
ncbi:energy transducer TonB family protein [Myxococcus xanthus]|nr:energy transducer TonB [Myxococcus xanthus]